MTQLKIGLQLYSVRQELDADFEGTLAQLAKMGYQFVELAGLHGYRPEYVHQVLSQNNLQVIAMHCDVLTEKGLAESLDAARVFGCHYLVCPWVDPITFSSKEGIRTFAIQLNKANQTICAAGKALCYHNHQFEFQLLDGELAFDLFVAQLNPAIKLQLDVYNIALAGVDPIEILSKYSDQIIMLHLKDGEIIPAKPNVAIGSGKLNYTTLLQAIPKTMQWQFIEFETCKSNIFGAIEMSKRFVEKVHLVASHPNS